MNVNSRAQSELRLAHAARLIEMHYRSVSPAGIEAAAIVHDPTAIGPQGEDGYSMTGKVSIQTKDDNRSNAPCILSFVMTSMNWPSSQVPDPTRTPLWISHLPQHVGEKQHLNEE